MDNAIRKERGYQKAKVSRIEPYIAEIEDSESQVSVEELEVRLAQVEQANLLFDQLQARLLDSVDADALPERDQLEDAEFEDRFIRASVSLKRLLGTMAMAANSMGLQLQHSNKQGDSSLQSDNKAEEHEKSVLPHPSNNKPLILAANESSSSHIVTSTAAPPQSNDALVRILEQQTALLTLLSSNQAQRREPQVKLPVVQLPNFDGKVEEWKRYSETFKSLIHNHAELSNIQKYQYLTSSFRGSAAKLIESIDISNENYEIAWELLRKRYDNPKSASPRARNENLSITRLNIFEC